MRIDAHQHFWLRERGDYDWLTPDLEPLWQDFLPDDLAPILEKNAIAGTILVQAAPTDEETAFMLSLARAHPFIRGVVGWTDLSVADAPTRIAALASDPLIVGLRPMLQDLPDDDAILAPQVQPALAAMTRHGLALDALIRPVHLPRLIALRESHPDLRVVIDHAAKPYIASGDLERWARDLKAVAADGITHCKLSGLVTEAAAGWTLDDLRPFVAIVLEAFGPERVMWGSDWPVLNLASDYQGWVGATHDLLSDLGPEQQASILGGTAQQFYRLEER
ncbi:amidohydrolase family protein [Erythrobacter sp.]|uniref:amidohydrolase family protein n=1 Tax=Erythrobacter sp. TaxID=1042 RepID=UPI001B050624|nr:amidohydrolase family protein [Erythrobacter sp.]MBO6525412.1 amidohydrolase family protein [Erythrobacter sp.]MBO6529915.1 amidohydrolase family protein [Erythrobacter sp.]